MKLLMWFFNFAHRHRRAAMRYSSGGLFRKIFYFIVITLAVIGSLLLLHFSFDLMIRQSELGAIILVILAGVFILGTIEFCITYSIFAFRTASSKSIQENSEELTESSEGIKTEKKYKTLDTVLGIYYLCLVFVLIGVTLLIFMNL